MAMRGRLVGIGGYRPPQQPMHTVSQTFRPKSDWRDEPNNAILILYLSGFIGEQIQVRRYLGEESIQVVTERRLANNRLMRVNETFTVPAGADLEKLETNFSRGILMVKMPKKKEEPSNPIDHNANPNDTPTSSLTPIPTPTLIAKPNHGNGHQTPVQLSASTPTATPTPNSNPTATHTPTLAPTPITQPHLDQKRPTLTQPMMPIPTPTAIPNPYLNPTTTHTQEPAPTPTTMPTRAPTFAVQPVNEAKAPDTIVKGTKDTKVLAPENNDPATQPKHSQQDQRSQEKEDQSKKKTDDKIMRELEMRENGQREMGLILSPHEKRLLLVNMGVAALLILGFIAYAYKSLI